MRDVLVQGCGCAALLADVLAQLVEDSAQAPSADAPSAPSAGRGSLLQSWLPLGTALAASATAAVEDAALPRAAVDRISNEDANEARLRLQLIDAICPSDPEISEETVRSMVRHDEALPP